MTTTTSPERRAELRAMPYEEYLLTPEWQVTRKRILKRDNYQCQWCKAKNVLFHVHHYTYVRLGCEDDTDLVTLCEPCHEELHRLMADPPKVPFMHRLGVGIGAAALGTVGIEGFLHAPLPAEIGVLVAAFLLAKNTPAIYGKLKENVPAEVMAWIGNAPEGNSGGVMGAINAWLGRSPKKPAQSEEEDEASDEEIAAYLKRNGVAEETITTMFQADPSEGRHPSTTIRDLEHSLGDVLEDFQIAASVLPEVTAVGPRIIRFGIVPTGTPQMEDGNPKQDEAGRVIYARRTRIEEIVKREKDIQLALGAKSIRILSPVPGRRYVGIEIPNPEPCMVTLTEVLRSREYQEACASSKLVVALGRDISGRVCVCDIEKAPHVLIGGATNSGKSVLLNVLIASLLSNATPDEVRLLMVDPKMVELTPYNGIAHLLQPVVTDMAQVISLLDQAITEMQRRYQIFAGLGVRNLAEYRKKRVHMPDLENLPSWVMIIDEFADLMMTAPTETEEKVIRIAQKARATGIHLVIATQKPIVKVITGLIKGNLPTSIALKTKTEVDSRVILDQGGAERLLGDGDMLYLPPNTDEPIRIQGAYMTDAESQAIISRWQTNAPQEVDRMPMASQSSVSNQALTVDTLVDWWTTGRITNEQFLVLMDKVSGRVTDVMEEDDEDPYASTPNNLTVLGRNVRATNAQNSPKFTDLSPVTEDEDDATYTQNVPSNQPVERAQTQNKTVKNYRLDAKQIAMFCALYPVHIASKDDALREIGANTSYRAHANEIIEEYHLMDKKRG